MKKHVEEAGALLSKAEHDLRAAEIGLEHGAPLDTVCFHLQQTAEKLLKTALAWKGISYPLTHDLLALAEQACGPFPALAEFGKALADLTPYAVRARYEPV